jgi:hypothetical protein
MLKPLFYLFFYIYVVSGKGSETFTQSRTYVHMFTTFTPKVPTGAELVLMVVTVHGG